MHTATSSYAPALPKKTGTHFHQASFNLPISSGSVDTLADHLLTARLMRTKTLLVAVSPEDREQVPVIAAHDFRTYIVSSVKEANPLLSRGEIDGIVCGVHFNDGDVFQFCEAVQANPQTASLPFIVVKGAGGRLNAGSYRAIELACKQRGIAYLDAVAKVQRLGTEAGYAELRRRVQELLQ